MEKAVNLTEVADGSSELGYRVAQKTAGHGLATAASRKVLEHNGFVAIGELTQGGKPALSYLCELRCAPPSCHSRHGAQRRYALREVFNGLRYIVKTGAHWRMMPHDLPPWPVVYHQMRRWMAAGCFETIVADLRVLLRRAADRPADGGHPR